MAVEALSGKIEDLLTATLSRIDSRFVRRVVRKFERGITVSEKEAQGLEDIWTKTPTGLQAE